MTKFRQKQYTIPEGHYTGPKDMDKVPGAIEVIGKSALAGAGIGGVTGSLLKDASITSGAITGGKYGTIAGVVLKFFLNYLHNPMSSIKFQEVDKLIRREFGIYRASGVTIGDSLDKRAKIDEKFSFNDRNVTAYKLNFSIQDNSITMYTFGMTSKELEKTSDSLDYYCKKYTGMEYSSYAINSRNNSYSVAIVFTNYQVIANFIMELSNTLGVKINLLDNKALVENRIKEVEQKDFSVKSLNKYDLKKFIGKTGKFLFSGKSEDLIGLIYSAAVTFSNDPDIILTYRGDFGNKYLENSLKRLRYVEGLDYTVGEFGGDIGINMSMISGIFVITVNKEDTNELKKIDSIFWNHLKTIVNRVDTGKVVVYNYTIKTRNEFDFILKKFMSTDVKPNIFEK